MPFILVSEQATALKVLSFEVRGSSFTDWETPAHRQHESWGQQDEQGSGADKLHQSLVVRHSVRLRNCNATQIVELSALFSRPR